MNRGSLLDCGGKRSATPLWVRVRKRRRRCALPAHSKTWPNFVPFTESFAARIGFVFILLSFCFWFFPRPVKRNRSKVPSIHVEQPYQFPLSRKNCCGLLR